MLANDTVDESTHVTVASDLGVLAVAHICLRSHAMFRYVEPRACPKRSANSSNPVRRGRIFICDLEEHEAGGVYNARSRGISERTVQVSPCALQTLYLLVIHPV